MIACDTGFFVAFLQGNAKALEVWSEALVTSEPIILSVISIYELRRLALKGEVLQAETEALLELLPILCVVVYLDDKGLTLVEQAARLAHGNGLSMADSLILASAMQLEAKVLFTTDSDMTKYKGKLGPEVVKL